MIKHGGSCSGAHLVERPPLRPRIGGFWIISERHIQLLLFCASPDKFVQKGHSSFEQSLYEKRYLNWTFTSIWNSQGHFLFAPLSKTMDPHANQQKLNVNEGMPEPVAEYNTHLLIVTCVTFKIHFYAAEITKCLHYRVTILSNINFNFLPEA